MLRDIIRWGANIIALNIVLMDATMVVELVALLAAKEVVKKIVSEIQRPIQCAVMVVTISVKAVKVNVREVAMVRVRPVHIKLINCDTGSH